MYRVSQLIKKIAGGEKTKQDLTADEARWLWERALRGELLDVQLGALLAAWRLKGETAAELEGCLRATAASLRRVPGPLPPGLVLTCGATSGKGHHFLAAPAALCVAAAAGLPVACVGLGGDQVRFPLTEVDVFRRLGVAVDLAPADVSRVLRQAGLVVWRQVHAAPALARLSALRVPLGMRTVAQAVEKFVDPLGAGAMVAGAFHLNYLERLAHVLARLAGQEGWAPAFLLLQERDGGVDVAPLHPVVGFRVRPGAVEPLRVPVEELGLRRVLSAEVPPLGLPETAALTEELLAGGGPEPLRSMVALSAGLLLFAGGKEERLARCVERAAAVLASGAGLRTLAALRQAAPAGGSGQGPDAAAAGG